MSKIVSIEEAVERIPDGAVIMCGGFLGCGTAHRIVEALSKSGKGGFTLISSDAGIMGGPLGEELYGVSKLIRNRQSRKSVV